MAGVTGAVGEVGVGICGFGMDVRFEEAVFQADQDIQEGQVIGGGGDGELDGGMKRVDVVEEHIQILCIYICSCVFLFVSIVYHFTCCTGHINISDTFLHIRSVFV